MTKILMVCLGNICRSPLAEGIMRSKLPKDMFLVDSAGTANYHIGSKPDNRSIKVALKYGLDISSQRGQQFKTEHFDQFDYIYAMDNSNYQNILRLTRNDEDRNKVKLILNEVYPEQNYDVPDPYYGGEHGFENVFKMLDEACDNIASKLI